MTHHRLPPDQGHRRSEIAELQVASCKLASSFSRLGRIEIGESDSASTRPVAFIMPDLLPKTHIYPPYRESDALNYALRTGFAGLGAGLFSACVKNAYFSTTTRAWTVVSVYGATVPIYGNQLPIDAF